MFPSVFQPGTDPHGPRYTQALEHHREAFSPIVFIASGRWGSF